MAKMALFDGYKLRIVEALDLSDFYAYINCEYIDITQRTVGGITFDVIVDDIGLLKTDSRVTMVDEKCHMSLVGNLLFCYHDSEGETVSIDPEGIDALKRNIKECIYWLNGDMVANRVIVTEDTYDYTELEDL